MTKSELIEKIAIKNPHLLHRDVERVVSVIFDSIMNALSDGDRVEIRGFGAFSIRNRKAREGRNPRTGEVVKVAPKNIPHFKIGKKLFDMLNK